MATLTFLIYRPTNTVCGFARVTLVEITTNIESQEYRRRENHIIGYPEHPRAGGTDDLETLFSIAHRRLGNNFTLKDWCNHWPNLVRYVNSIYVHTLHCFQTGLAYIKDVKIKYIGHIMFGNILMSECFKI